MGTWGSDLQHIQLVDAVPDMDPQHHEAVNGANLAMSVTAESFTSSSIGRMWVRARVRRPANDADDVVFARETLAALSGALIQ